MSNVRLCRAVFVSAIAAVTACNGRSSSMPEDAGAAVPEASTGADGPVTSGDASPGGDGAADASASDDAGAAPDTGGDGSPSGQLDLPGIVVWLDGDLGIDTSQPGTITWTDRSRYAHVFVGQTVLGGDLPSTAQWNGHQAVRFNSRNRFVSEAVPSAAQMDALTLGDTFIVAVAFLPELDPTFVPDPGGGTVSPLAMALSPWIPDPPETQSTIVPAIPSFALETFDDDSLDFQTGPSELRVPGTFEPSPQRVILSTGGDNGIRVRLNGQLQTGMVTAREIPSQGAYAPVYVGDWDLDWLGFHGLVAEMIIVRGSADEATEQALDRYLEAKYFP